MNDEKPIIEPEEDDDLPDPDEVPIADRRVSTQPYDLVVGSLISQIKGNTIFLRPLSERPGFQRRYVWNDVLASRLIESLLLNVPIPACYLSQNEDFELDVIDGQQRLYSIYRFCENQFQLKGLEVLKEFNKKRFHELPSKTQRQLSTHTLRCIAITNESHSEIKFDVFERLNTNTVPLNAQELRNCVYRGPLNTLIKDVVENQNWLSILKRKEPDKRMRDEELVLRFFAFEILGLDSYRTPLKHWLNDAAKKGKSLTSEDVAALGARWHETIEKCLMIFPADKCFRRPTTGKAQGINRALFDLTMYSVSRASLDDVISSSDAFRSAYISIIQDGEFDDLISRAVDHTKRTKRRFEIWQKAMRAVF